MPDLFAPHAAGRARHAAYLALAGALLTASACTDRDPTEPGVPHAAAPTRAHAAIFVSSPEIATLSVEVRAEDLRDPLVYDLSLQDGRSEASLVLPSGYGRRLMIRAHDRTGAVTHEGESYLDKVADGDNPAIEAELKPVADGEVARAEIGLAGEEPAKAVIELRAERVELLEGESVRLRATVTDPSGQPLDVRSGELRWAVSDLRGMRILPLEKDDYAVELQLLADIGAARAYVTFRDHISWVDIYVRRNPWVAVAAGSDHSCALRQNGAAACWGSNYYGQLGTTAVPSTSCSGWLCVSATPVAVTGYTFTAIDAAGGNSCGLTSVGRIYCWGSNSAGQLGNGATGGQSSTPVVVKSKLTFTAVAVGYMHACGLVTTGDVWCWGSNASGQLGNGGTTASPVPVRVSGGFKFRSIAAGGAHSCGIADSTFKPILYPAASASSGDRLQAASSPRALGSPTQMLCWGSSYWGQLGDNTSGASAFATTPQVVQSGNFFARLGDFESSNSSCAINAYGAASCWGDNYTGQLGTGNTTPVATQAPVTGGLAFSGVSISSFHACGVTTGYEAYCWGFNGYGELGNPASAGTSGVVLAPVPVVGKHQFSAVTVGFNHSCAVRLDGRILCWGAYNSGQLGNGMTGPIPSWTSTPVLVL